MRIVSVVGTRPQLIKAAALAPVLRARHDEILVDTGQHWDEAMAGAFFAELGLPRPDHSLGIGGGSNAEQTGADAGRPRADRPRRERPDAVLVYGDTNSTLAGALVAAKLTVPVAHVEAGLRSFDRRMPEEVNRVVADHLSRWLFAPTPTAVANLAAEGIVDGVTAGRRPDAGPRGADACRRSAIAAVAGAALPPTPAPRARRLPLRHDPPRREPRRPRRSTAWAALLGAVATRGAAGRAGAPPGHPGRARATPGSTCPPDVRVVEPQGYRTSLALQLHAAAVLTDSGGVQREAAWLGVPCLDPARHRRSGSRRSPRPTGGWWSSGSTANGPSASWLAWPRRPRRRSAPAPGPPTARIPPAGAVDAIVAALG